MDDFSLQFNKYKYINITNYTGYTLSEFGKYFFGLTHPHTRLIQPKYSPSQLLSCKVYNKLSQSHNKRS